MMYPASCEVYHVLKACLLGFGVVATNSFGIYISQLCIHDNTKTCLEAYVAS